MKCEEFLSLLPMYPDAMPSAQAASELRMHAAECKECAARLAEHELMISSLQALDDGLELPEGFAVSWRKAVQNDTTPPRKNRFRGLRGGIIAAAACATVFIGTALMQNGVLFPTTELDKQTAYSMESSATSAPYAAKRTLDSGSPVMARGAYAAESETALQANEIAQNPIVLHSASLYLDTANYDEDISQIDRFLADTGGWSEYWSVTGEPIEQNPDSGRHVSMTLRIPMEMLDSFIDRVSQVGRLTGSEITAEDVSSNYYDVQGRLAMYETQRDRLTELLSQADSMADIIEIEGRISEIQYTIESLVGRLNNWNSRANNAIVRINVTEVSGTSVAEGAGLWSRIKNAFGTSLRAASTFLKDALVFMVMAAPYIALVAVAALLLTAVVKMRKRHNSRQRSREE